MNIYTILAQAAQRYPDNIAVYTGDQPVLSFKELHDRALQIAGYIRQTCAPGDRIAISSHNCPEYLELLFGVWAAGCVVVPVNYKLHALEITSIVKDAEATLIFTSESLSQAIATALQKDDVNTRLIEIGSPAYTQYANATALKSPYDSAPQQLAWLFYTSGTTGKSKGAMLSHRNLMAMSIAHLADFENITQDQGIIHAAPISHASGLYMIPYISRGARNIIPQSGGFDAEEILKLSEVHHGCGIFLAPTMVQRLRLKAEEPGIGKGNLCTILYGGGPMYLEEIKLCLAVFGQIFIQLYGQGEAPVTITGLLREGHASKDDTILASVGWARSGVEVAVVDKTGQAVSHGEMGEIICRGDVVMSGYWNNPKATKETLKDGWLWTGDIGTLDADGKLTLRDRSKDVIISGGTNIYPREVEEVLLCHPHVLEVCVVGQADPEWGETICAFVVTDAGCEVTKAELDKYCLSKIARFKRPKRYIFLNSLPKNSYGKILKRTLAEQL
ncbi:MAG: AMP-binding protein [Kordiimonadaceae bacterium]|nr:AMP-binding protein [Kordiimonadaceae bacterium]